MKIVGQRSLIVTRKIEWQLDKQWAIFFNYLHITQLAPCHQQELAPVSVAINCSQCSWSTWHKQVHVCAQTHTHTQMCELIILHACNILFLSSLHHSILLPILYPFHQNSNFSHFTGWKDENPGGDGAWLLSTLFFTLLLSPPLRWPSKADCSNYPSIIIM